MSTTFSVETLQESGQNLKKAAQVLRAVNHRLRSEILLHIEKKGQLTVTELVIILRLEQPVVSQHLGILRQAGIVITNRQGKHILYELDKDYIHHVQESAVKLITKPA